MVQQGEVDAGGEEDHTGAVPGVRSRRRWRLRQGLGDWETEREGGRERFLRLQTGHPQIPQPNRLTLLWNSWCSTLIWMIF
ncbi:hypothetical protein BRADI_5g26231v3 [Brachypodium distachyon]|uniref:Uncharacterized protein n=1 Tax=Brachypodium distachyon TaxID=15368 RepID=A0A0Q3IGD1_BRADI|nr:hypothetical protein BRADI_5g26231v3 [Brachypodium distachyon]